MHLVVKNDLYPDRAVRHGLFLSDGEHEIEIRDVESLQARTLAYDEHPAVFIRFRGGEITLETNHMAAQIIW